MTKFEVSVLTAKANTAENSVSADKMARLVLAITQILIGCLLLCFATIDSLFSTGGDIADIQYARFRFWIGTWVRMTFLLNPITSCFLNPFQIVCSN